MESHSILMSHLTSAAMFAYALQLLQKWDKMPWVTAHTAWVNIGLRALFSFAATLGIGFVWAGSFGAGVLTVTIPAATVLAHGLYHFLGQFSMQHAWLKVFQLESPKP